MDPRRAIPRTDHLLALPQAQDAVRRVGRDRVKAVIAQALAAARSGELAPDAVQAHVESALVQLSPPPATRLREVLNATGVVLHTNIGRASLSAPAREALQAASGHVDVELDLTTGRRARRGRATLAALAALVPAAEDVLVVNNGAAALVLATTALARDAEVLVSRGEMVEIGDGFRLPELIESTGARLCEVGTTNRTTLQDYASAVVSETRAVLKVHPSNFRVEGFTSAASVKELATLGLPVISDVGSGLLQPHPLLPDEPDVTTALLAGAGLVTASGDKLFGGPQAGLIFGTAELVNRLRRHPLARALRADKLTLAALEATAVHGYDPSPTRALPTWAGLLAAEDEQHHRVQRLVAELHTRAVECQAVSVTGAVGGGGAPGQELPGWAISLPEPAAVALRAGTPAVLARVEASRTLVDPRGVDPERDSDLIHAIVAAMG